MAEAYTTLTRANRYALPTHAAARIIDHTSRTFKIVSLTSGDYVRAIEEASLLALGGLIIYDALLMACARKISARRIYTLNVKHFRKVAPELASRIVEP